MSETTTAQVAHVLRNFVLRCDRCRQPRGVQVRCLANGDQGCVDCYRAENLAQPRPGKCVNCGVKTDERDCEGNFCHVNPCHPPAALTYLGYANNWPNYTNALVEQCRAAQHGPKGLRSSQTVGNCVREYSCSTCGYRYRVDSGD